MMNANAKHIEGFTLIELMIVIAIIGILSALAIPTYQDYSKRSRVSEALSLAGGAKSAVSEYYASHNQLPSNNTVAGLANASQITGNSVSSVEVKDGKITVTFNTKVAQGKTLELTPDVSQAGAVTWDCKGGTLGGVYRPSECRGTP